MCNRLDGTSELTRGNHKAVEPVVSFGHADKNRYVWMPGMMRYIEFSVVLVA